MHEFRRAGRPVETLRASPDLAGRQLEVIPQRMPIRLPLPEMELVRGKRGQLAAEGGKKFARLWIAASTCSLIPGTSR
jgi:hypothetical protein